MTIFNSFSTVACNDYNFGAVTERPRSSLFLAKLLKAFVYLLRTDLGCENSASCYRQGRQLLLTLLTLVTRR